MSMSKDKPTFEGGGGAESTEARSTALVPAPPAKNRRKPRPKQLKARTQVDDEANPVDETDKNCPKLKNIILKDRPSEQAHALIEAILSERDSNVFGAFFRSMNRVSTRRAVAHGVGGAGVALKAMLLFGPLAIAVWPASLVIDRVRETRRVRAGKPPLAMGKTESDLLLTPAVVLKSPDGSDRAEKESLPWELRCQWLVAAWRFFRLAQHFNKRVAVVNGALTDATLPAAQHQAAERMSKLLCREYIRIQGIRRFLEDQMYGGDVKLPFTDRARQLAANDDVVLKAELFGTENGRYPPIDWLLLSSEVFTHRQLIEQHRRDQEYIASNRAVEKDALSDEIAARAREDTKRQKRLSPPEEDQ